MRTNGVLRRSMPARAALKAAALALAGGLAIGACSSTQLGAAAIAGNTRITVSTLTSKVSDLNSAYAADKTKHLQPQRPVAQEAQQVLTWLILFQVYDEMARQHHISVSQAQIQAARKQFSDQAKQSNVTLEQYWSAGGALPPSLLTDLEQAAAIQTALASQLNGGTPAATAAAQQTVAKQISHQQCLAAKSLGINVNPQYGVYDYSGFSVVAVPSTLAADPTPAPQPSSLRRTPRC